MVRRCRHRERLAAAPESGCQRSERGSGMQGKSGTLLSAVAMENAIGWQNHQAGNIQSITYNIHRECVFVKKAVEKPLRYTPPIVATRASGDGHLGWQRGRAHHARKAKRGQVTATRPCPPLPQPPGPPRVSPLAMRCAAALSVIGILS
jgi:hypothetical protein